VLYRSWNEKIYFKDKEKELRLPKIKARNSADLYLNSLRTGIFEYSESFELE